MGLDDSRRGAHETRGDRNRRYVPYPSIQSSNHSTSVRHNASNLPSQNIHGLGTGEALNEMQVGYSWPSFRERAERFEEAIQIMKLLWSREIVDFKGKYFKLRKANLYTKPTSPPPIHVAASGKTSARIAGKHADGLLTLLAPEEHYRNVVFPALEEGAKSAHRDSSKIIKALSSCLLRRGLRKGA